MWKGWCAIWIYVCYSIRENLPEQLDQKRYEDILFDCGVDLLIVLKLHTVFNYSHINIIQHETTTNSNRIVIS